MPPVLHVPLAELPRGGAQDLLAQHLAPRHREGHGVLELVAEAEGAPRLIEGGARLDAAGEGLIEEPAVDQEVERAVGRPHLERPQDVVPAADDVG